MINNTNVQEIISLLNNGFRPYNNQPQNSVYESLTCLFYKKNKPAWFYKGDIFLCISCNRKCSLHRPTGFQAPIPLKYPHYNDINYFKNTPQELIVKKASLNMKEVCYCLNMSYSKVYSLIQEGKLTSLNGRPLRVKTEDVQRLMEDYNI